jgi:uncharacterized protein YaiI (UPF0178 family)
VITIYVDADACPVKDEVYVVATRYGVPVALVANAPMQVPNGFGVERVVVARVPTRRTTGSPCGRGRATWS